MGFILIFSFNSPVSIAQDLQILSGEEAYQLFQKLPGKACLEYRNSSYSVYTKYQTKKCNQIQEDKSKWICTVQFSLAHNKVKDILSAECSRNSIK